MTKASHTNSKTKAGTKGWFSNGKSLAESAFVSAIVSGVISGAVLIWGEVQLENSKERVASLVREQVEFNNAQSNVFSQLQLYTGHIFEKVEPQNTDQLQSAIIVAELQVNRLMVELPKEHDLLSKYADELSALSKSIRDVKGPSDLGPALATAQKLLELHDQVADRLTDNMGIGVFPTRKS